MAATTTSTGDSGSRSTESEALKLSFSYLQNSIDTASVLPFALSARLITQQQRSDCAREQDLYKKAEIFLSHLERVVNGDNTKFHTFVQVLKRTNQEALAKGLQGLYYY